MSEEAEEKRNARHKAAMEKQKENVDAGIAAASEERGVAVLVTGNGKAKSSSAFGMVIRALGYGQKVGVVQFIKGEQLSGEEIYLKEHCPQVRFYQMGTGFTWDTQDRTADIAAAERTWAVAA
ncbi:MAG: cob(I)yrinic acid a,c-diamide adenosyltransferase, partial [Pseudomonadota bacterium]